MIELQQSQALTSHFETFWSIVQSIRFSRKINFDDYTTSKDFFDLFLKVLNFDITKISALRHSYILPKSESRGTSIGQNGQF